MTEVMDERKRFCAGEARLVAEGLLGQMRPHCRTLAIAGSLRRGKALVVDLEPEDR